MAGMPSGRSGWRARLGRFRRDASGLAAVEAALLSPVVLGLLGLVVFGGEGLSIQRKVTLASRTVADLVGQAPVSAAGNGTGTATLNQSDLDYYLSLSALILYPYAASGAQAELSEVQVASGGGATATVIWSEGYNGLNGWAIDGSTLDDPRAQDERDANILYEILEREVKPLFFSRDSNGIPVGWLARIRASLRTLAPMYSSARMLEDYATKMYRPRT